MAVTPADFLRLAYTEDLTRAGLAYACRSLPHTFDRMGGSPFERLRRIVAGIAVELALRRHLNEQEVPFDVRGATPFTEPDRYDLSLGGRRCDVKSYLVYRKGLIRELRRAPEQLLAAPALVPADQVTSQQFRHEDLYVFAFLFALVAPTPRATLKAQAAGQPSYLIHPMPSAWARPVRWASLGRLALKSDASMDLDLELGGLDRERQFQQEALSLAPRRRRQPSAEFYALHYLHSGGTPDGQVGVHSPAMGETYLAAPEAWGNIWVYGMEVVLVGYLPCGEFRRRARRLAPGSAVLQYAQTRTENLALPIGELRPMADLFIRARNWSSRR